MKTPSASTIVSFGLTGLLIFTGCGPEQARPEHSFSENVATKTANKTANATLRALQSADNNLSPTQQVLAGIAPLELSDKSTTGDVIGKKIVIPTNLAKGISISEANGATVTIGLPTSDKNIDKGVEVTSGIYSYELSDFIRVVPVVKLSGSVQIVSIIESARAATTFTYPITAPRGASLTMQKDGSVALLDENGAAIGAFEIPWAIDASGRSVLTHYEIDGLTLTQVIEHITAGVTYPVVADPNYSWDIFDWAWYRYNSTYHSNQLSISISALGRSQLVANPAAFALRGWGLIVRDFSYPVSVYGATLRQQWDCHVLGGMLEWGTFDLEVNRPSNPFWPARVGHVWPPSATCNW